MADGQYTNNIEQTKENIRERYSRQRDMSKVTFIPARKEIRPYDSSVRKRVVVYCRVSTDGISQYTSFELQKNYYLKYVRQRPDWKLVALYSDEGITATSMDKRIGLLTMLDDARAGKFDLIIVKNLSRLNRNLKDCLSIVDELRKLPHPVGILFETENMFTLDKNVDFTLTVLSLVAEEESHKKAEAMNASYYMRFSQGDFMKPSLLGYQRIGVNEIGIDEEEAKTVRLIFDMYRSGIHPDTIAKVLIRLGRKTHQYTTKGGKVVGGKGKWTGETVKSVMKNERRAGDVLAQKTYTPDFRDHKSVANNGALPQFYARDQHEAIISQEEFEQANRMLKANAGGWKYGLQQFEVFEGGAFKGFVGAAPNWRGFDPEDYNRAGLKAQGYSEEQLDEIEKKIQEQIEEEEKKLSALSIGFQHTYAIDSDNYDLFPDVDEIEDSDDKKDESRESFAKWVDKTSKEIDQQETDKYRFSKYNFDSCEVIRPEFFSIRDKANITFDYRGMYFSKTCCSKLTNNEQLVENVDVFYNPTEKLLIIKKADQKTSRSLHWNNIRGNAVNMIRCSSVGLVETIYSNMGWDNQFRYRVLGMKVKIGGEDVLVFSLCDSFTIVSAKLGSQVSLDTDNISAEEAEKMMREGKIPSNGFVPDLDDFRLGNGPMSKSAKIMARSRAIYFDELTDRVSGTIHVSEMKDKKFDPKCIQSLIQRGITPEEGWYYLRGMAVINKFGFTIFQESWDEKCGKKYYESTGLQIKSRFADCTNMIAGIPYGWTVGLDLPSQNQIREEIAQLEAENQRAV